MGFLGLCDLVSKKRHKATTPNGISQSINAIIKMYRNDDIRMYKFHYISDTICMR